jgi:hypothetical protein
MTTSYRNNFRNATREAFARQAAIDAFGPRAVHRLNSDVFIDRAGGVDGREAIARWLAIALNTEAEDAEVAYQTADELRQVLGLTWDDVLQRRAA